VDTDGALLASATSVVFKLVCFMFMPVHHL